MKDGDFKGRLLEAVSDADMAAYADGRLGGPPGCDTVSVVRPDRLLSVVRVAKVEAGNPATGGGITAVTPDGCYAIIMETVGPWLEDKADATIADLLAGRSESKERGEGRCEAEVEATRSFRRPLQHA